MRKHLIGTFRTRAFRLRAWKILNAVVAVATVANISLVGVLLPKAALAAPASIWTTRTTCVNPDPQDENEYFAGDTVYIRGSNFLANTQYYWTINGQPGSADPGDPSDPSDSPIANGTVTTDVDGYFCLGAYVIGSDGDTDAGVYTVDVSETADMKQSKNDNYHVDGGMLTVHKLADTDGNGSFEVTVDSEGGFAWKIVGTSDWRFFGTSVELAPDDYQVEENDINGYHMVGWTYGSPEQFDGNICEDGELSDAATAPVEIGNNETTHVT
ncbi:MAG: hypothetical protein HY976_02100, partial [Candidatus Kerfeldbacteria bacterium]|nr:hypothetical protein [Candidatus Kerfeldbacteria bacterium]